MNMVDNNRIRKQIEVTEFEECTGDVTREYVFTVVEDEFVDYKKGEHFIKIFDNELYHYSDKMSGSEATVFNKLLKYINYGDNMIVKRTLHNKTVEMSLTDIKNELNLSKSSSIRIMNSLVDIGAIGLWKTKGKNQYFVNPNIAMRGNKISKFILERFKRSKTSP